VLYDLGCGDGRICIEAAESRGAKACGVEIEENLADKFRRRVAAKGLESKVSVVHGDLRDLDLSDATVLVMYLLPEAMGDIAQSHLLPFLRRGRRCTPPPPVTTRLAGDEETPHHCDSSSSAVLSERGVKEGGRCTPPRGTTPLAGDEETPHQCDSSSAVLPEGGVDEGEGGSVGGRRGRSGSARGAKPFPRIVCNTWGIPGATAVREAGVGMYGGVKLRLFTHESLPVDAA
ncbi:unnamed protein product, partial [Laminaria digitata]